MLDFTSVVVLEGLYEGSKDACEFTKGGIFRGKGFVKKNGIHEMRYTDNGEYLYLALATLQ